MRCGLGELDPRCLSPVSHGGLRTDAPSAGIVSDGRENHLSLRRDGIIAALNRAKAAAGDRDVRVGGGAATIRQYLSAKLIDELHLAMAPTLLGTGEPLFTGIDLPALGYTVTECVPTPAAVHYVLTRGGEGKSGDAE